MPPKWQVPPVTTMHISEAVFLVREHCRRVGAFAQETPKCRATAQYLDEVMGSWMTCLAESNTRIWR